MLVALVESVLRLSGVKEVNLIYIEVIISKDLPLVDVLGLIDVSAV